ncbi:thiamine phosphate synthase [Pelagicoccus sp. NFK12]|uniref:Thiamine-phosphate synthase n=1 Tax=Pelagicoccus enzymogenes TaxID=2773457 RepID=A0A927F5S1_9BACT|nr:thiamine phosphate synthase [Pelagicoccus enzymogenes]MBD5778384.1 thiamine phosphate synthase [Pelagicoccus enzymogenes]
MNLSLHQSTFYGILDTGYVSPENWVAKYEALVSGGASIVQIRAKDSNQSERYQLTEQIVRYRAQSAAPQPHLVINDDLELALEHPDLGLHVGQEDLPAVEARKRLGPNRLLGLSTHSPEQARAAMALPAGTLNYFAVGPVFATQTKPTYTPVGLELVEYVAKQRPELPFFCIGGINRRNIEQVIAAGASRIVTVSDVLCSADTAAAVRESISIARK